MAKSGAAKKSSWWKQSSASRAAGTQRQWSKFPNLLFLLLASVSALTGGAPGCGLQHSQPVRNLNLLPPLSADDFLQGFCADYVPFFILSLTGIWSQEREILPQKICLSCTFFCPSAGRAKQWEIISPPLQGVKLFCKLWVQSHHIRVWKQQKHSKCKWAWGNFLVMDTWDKNVGMDANLAGLTLKKSAADDW